MGTHTALCARIGGEVRSGAEAHASHTEGPFTVGADVFRHTPRPSWRRCLVTRVILLMTAVTAGAPDASAPAHSLLRELHGLRDPAGWHVRCSETGHTGGPGSPQQSSFAVTNRVIRMIDFKATALSHSMRPQAASPSLAGLKQLLSPGPVQDTGVRRGPVDSFEPGVINRRQPATFAPRGLPQELQNLAPAPQSSGSGIPSANDKRPAGDTRSAAQIVDGTPVLKNLGRQKDIKFEQLCKQTGVDPKLDLKDPKQNPDAVYRLAKVLEYIDSSKSSKGGDRASKVQNGQGDGNIEGITKDGDARHGTEAGMVKDFAEQGYASLGTDHQLPTTNDTHVKEDGSNKDNFQWFAGEVGKKLWFLPLVSNVLTGVGNSEGGFKGVLEGAATGYLNTLKGAAEGIVGSITKGRPNPASLIFGGVMGALGNTEAAPQPVKDIAKLF
jgi:hypothetical protein